MGVRVELIHVRAISNCNAGSISYCSCNRIVITHPLNVIPHPSSPPPLKHLPEICRRGFQTYELFLRRRDSPDFVTRASEIAQSLDGPSPWCNRFQCASPQAKVPKGRLFLRLTTWLWMANLRGNVDQWICHYTQRCPNRTQPVDSTKANSSRLICPLSSHDLPALALASCHAPMGV